MFALFTQVLLKNYHGTEGQPVSKKPGVFLAYMPMEPQSGRGSQSTNKIYHQHKDLHKMQQWQSRSLKSSVFLYLEGFKYMFPMKAALGMKLPLRGYIREELGLWSLAALLTTPLFHFIAKSLCLLQQLSHKDSYHFSAVFLSHFLCLTGHKGTVSAAQDSHSPSCWWQHRTGLFHLLSKYSTNTGH